MARGCHFENLVLGEIVSFSAGVRASLNRSASAVRARLPRRIQSWLWDFEYRHGKWSYLDGFDDAPVLDLLRRYAPGDPHVLDLGCGTAQNLHLPETVRYHGVDISESAIETARGAGRANMTFEVADVTRYVPAEKFDVVLMREILYYLPMSGVRALFEQLPEMVLPGGIVVVQIWSKDTYRDLVEAVRGTGYTIVEEPARADGGSTMVISVNGG